MLIFGYALSGITTLFLMLGTLFLDMSVAVEVEVGMGDDGIGGDDVGSSAKGVGLNLDRDWAAALEASDDNFLNLNFVVLFLED